MKKVRSSKQGQISKKVEQGVQVVVTYHPLLNKMTSIIHRNLYLLYMNQEVKNIFNPGCGVSFRSAQKRISYLVRMCEVCLNIEETDIFMSTTLGKSFKINQKLLPSLSSHV